jgi:pyridoxal phosphate enzyme (YggS family)
VLAATKGVSADGIRAVLSAGVGLLGENRVQEALPKMAALEGSGACWHFIGRVQRRKVRDIVGRFDCVQSVDTYELAQEIDRRADAAGLTQAILVEVNLGGEATKGGAAPGDVLALLRLLDTLSHVRVLGLMAIPPAVVEAEQSRPYFKSLRNLAAWIEQESAWQRVRMEEISMGMSHDFEVAVEEGATLVRVGTAIFGARPGSLVH